jgi:hypothetical protein
MITRSGVIETGDLSADGIMDAEPDPIIYEVPYPFHQGLEQVW